MRLSLIILATTVSLIVGCGWQLRGTQQVEQSMPEVTVASEDTYSPMARTLREVWEDLAGSEYGDARYTVRIIQESVDRRPVTYTASGTPAQYEMTLQLTYAISGGEAEGLTPPRTVSTHRIFDFDPRNVVAKSEEERVLLQQMRQQLARGILNEISRQYHLTRDTVENSSE
jgi:LPS-assembly lipoprotein